MNKKVISLLLSLFILALTGGYSTVFASTYNNVPPRMQPNTILIFNDDLTYDIIQGGELTQAQLRGEDSNIDLVGINSTTLGAQPRIKVTYDQHGVISNVYYPSITNIGEYQLNNPKSPKMLLDDFHLVRQQVIMVLTQIMTTVQPGTTNYPIVQLVS